MQEAEREVSATDHFTKRTEKRHTGGQTLPTNVTHTVKAGFESHIAQAMYAMKREVTIQMHDMIYDQYVLKTLPGVVSPDNTLFQGNGAHRSILTDDAFDQLEVCK